MGSLEERFESHLKALGHPVSFGVACELVSMAREEWEAENKNSPSITARSVELDESIKLENEQLKRTVKILGTVVSNIAERLAST